MGNVTKIMLILNILAGGAGIFLAWESRET